MKFPFARRFGEKSAYVSIHDAIGIRIEGPERITVDSPAQQKYWSARVVVHTAEGKRFVLNLINAVGDEALDEDRPSVDHHPTMDQLEELD